MKKRYYPSFRTIFALTLLVPILISACDVFSSNNKEDTLEVKADIAGEQWAGASDAKLEDGVLTVQGTQGENECNSENIAFSIGTFDGPGSYTTHQKSYFNIVGCDGVSSIGFSADTSGTATITHYDKETRLIEGEFNFELVGRYDSGNIKKGEPFTVTGTFKTKLPSSKPYEDE